MEFDFQKTEPIDRYRLMIQTIVPRPIAWTLTMNESGNYNLAPFSYFNAVHSNPPLLMLSIGNCRDKSPKDTRRNIERDERFVVHIASSPMAEKVTLSANAFEPDVSEVEACGLSLTKEWGFSLPRLTEAKVAFGCRLERVIEIGGNKQGLVFGEIETLYVEDALVSRQGEVILIDAAKLNPLGRLGGDDYLVDGSVLTVQRPEYRPH